MAFSRDEILKAWDKAIARVARNHEDPSDEEIDAATAVVCAKCPGVTPDNIRDALRSNIEELQGEVAAADRTLRILEALVKERDGTLPGLPGGPPLKH
jgi:hypothetical protein